MAHGLPQNEEQLPAQSRKAGAGGSSDSLAHLSTSSSAGSFSRAGGKALLSARARLFLLSSSGG